MLLQRLTGYPRPPGMAPKAARAPSSWRAGGRRTGMRRTSRTRKIIGRRGTARVALGETAVAQGMPGVPVIRARETALSGGALDAVTRGMARQGDRLAGACLRMRTETGVGPRGVTSGAAQSESPALEAQQGRLHRGRARPTTPRRLIRPRRKSPPLPAKITRWRMALKQRVRTNLKWESQRTLETMLPKRTPKLTMVMQLQQQMPEGILNTTRPKANRRRVNLKEGMPKTEIKPKARTLKRSPKAMPLMTARSQDASVRIHGAVVEAFPGAVPGLDQEGVHPRETRCGTRGGTCIETRHHAGGLPNCTRCHGAPGSPGQALGREAQGHLLRCRRHHSSATRATSAFSPHENTASILPRGAIGLGLVHTERRQTCASGPVRHRHFRGHCGGRHTGHRGTLRHGDRHAGLRAGHLPTIITITTTTHRVGRPAGRLNGCGLLCGWSTGQGRDTRRSSLLMCLAIMPGT